MQSFHNLVAMIFTVVIWYQLMILSVTILEQLAAFPENVSVNTHCSNLEHFPNCNIVLCDSQNKIINSFHKGTIMHDFIMLGVLF